MTDATMNLKTLIEKTPDADLLREMIGFAAERLMEMEVGVATGAGYGEKSVLRLAAILISVPGSSTAALGATQHIILPRLG